MSTETAVKPKQRWVERMFQMRFGFFMAAVAGCALICWSIIYYQTNIDITRSMFNQQIATLRTSPNASARRAAAQALDGVRPSQLGIGAPALIAATKDPDPSVRAAAALSLATSLVYYFNLTNGEIPPQRDTGSLAIIDLLGDSNAIVRSTAARSLDIMSQKNMVQGGKTKSLSLDLKVVSPALTKLLDDPDPVVVLEAFRTLRNLGADPAPMLPSLRRISREASPKGRAEAIATLAQSLRILKESPLELLAYLDNDQPKAVRVAVARGLFRPWRDADAVALALAHRLDAGEPDERSALVQTLASIPKLPAEVAPSLIRVLERDHSDIRDVFQRIAIYQAAPTAILNLPPTAAVKAVPTLAKMARLPGGDGQSAKGALIMLSTKSELAQSLIPQLIKELREAGRWEDQIGLVELLGLFGSDAAEAAPLLLEIVTRKSPSNDPRQVDLHRAACKSLEKIGPDGAGFAVPTLAKYAENLSKGQVFADDVYDAILSLAPGSPEAAELLVRINEISEANDRGDTPDAIAYLRKLRTRLTSLDNPTLNKLAESSDPETKAHARAVLKFFKSP